MRYAAPQTIGAEEGFCRVGELGELKREEGRGEKREMGRGYRIQIKK